MKQLWSQPPLIQFDDYKSLMPGAIEYSIAQPIGRFVFVPLVCERFNLLAELDIVLLRPEPPGSIITSGGDIDNRLKTLFDSLKIPKELGELSEEIGPDEDERPFYCLTEDDSLISRVSIETDQLLEPTESLKDVVIIIKVNTIRISSMTGGDDDIP